MMGLVLTAGGARGAYQAGVLKRIGEIPALRGRAAPFSIIAGASAGAINGAMIGATSADMQAGTQRLAELWSDLSVHNVFRSDALSLACGGIRWLRDLALGGLIGGGTVPSLLDATPLRAHRGALPDLRHQRIDPRRPPHAIAVSATSYHSGKSYTFIRAAPAIRCG
jgi:NTE family protein